MQKNSHYLDMDHPSLKSSPQLCQEAVELLFRYALNHTAVYRITFDPTGLAAALGDDMKVLMPHLTSTSGHSGLLGRSSLVHEEPFDTTKTDLLLSLLSFELKSRPDLPLNYLEAIELLDQDGELILGAYDHLSSLCFNLTDDEIAQIKNVLRNRALPTEVIETV